MITLLYLICPDVLSTVGETSYGLWVGFIESDVVCTALFIYLFIYSYLRCNISFCLVNQIQIIF